MSSIFSWCFTAPFLFIIPFENLATTTTNNYINSTSDCYLVENIIDSSYKYSEGILTIPQYDFNIMSENNIISIYKLFFTKEDKYILFAYHKPHNNNNNHKKAAYNQYFHSILYLDRKQKLINYLLKVDTDIKSINFNPQYNLIFCIVNNQVLGYKLDDNKLIEVYKLSENIEAIDISLNFDASLLAIAFKSSKLAILKLMNEPNINFNYGYVYRLPIKKIVSIQFSVTDPIIAIENTNKIKTSIILFEVTKDNQLGLPLYNTPVNHDVVKYVVTPIEKQVVLQTIDNSYNNKQLKIVGEKNYINYYPNPISKTNIDFNEEQTASTDILDFTVCNNKDTIITIKKSADNKVVLYFISVYYDEYNFQKVTKKIAGKSYDQIIPNNFYPYNLQYQRSQEVFTEANLVEVNKDASVVAVIGNNRIQIYNVKYSLYSYLIYKLYRIFFLLPQNIYNYLFLAK